MKKPMLLLLALLMIFASCSPDPGKSNPGEETIVSSFPSAFQGAWNMNENGLLVIDSESITAYSIVSNNTNPSEGTGTEEPESVIVSQSYSLKDDNLLIICKDTDEYKSVMSIITYQGESEVMNLFIYPDEENVIYLGEKGSQYASSCKKYDGTAADWAKENGLTLSEGEETPDDNPDEPASDIDEKIKPYADTIIEAVEKLSLSSGKLTKISDTEYSYTFVDNESEVVTLPGVQFEGTTYPQMCDIIFEVYGTNVKTDAEDESYVTFIPTSFKISTPDDTPINFSTMDSNNVHMYNLDIEEISGSLSGITISEIDPGTLGETSSHTIDMTSCKLTADTVKGTLTERDLM